MAKLKFKSNGKWESIAAFQGEPGKDGAIQYTAGKGINIENDTISAEVDKQYVDDAVANAGGDVDTSNIQEFPTIDLTDYISYTESGNSINITDAGKAKLSELFTNYYKRHNTIVGLNFTITSRKYNPRGFKMLMLYRDEFSAGNAYFYQIMFPADSDISNMSYTSMNFNYTVSEDGTVTLGRIGDWGSDFKNGLSKNRISDYVLTKNNTTSFTPTSDYHPATKKYVDDNLGSASAVDSKVRIIDVSSSAIDPVSVDYKFTALVEDSQQAFCDFINESYDIETSNHTLTPIIICNYHRTIITINGFEFSNISDGTKQFKFNFTITNPGNGQLRTGNFDIRLKYENDKYVINKGYVNAQDNIRYLTKYNTSEYTPSSNYHPATKKYVDDAIAALRAELGGE